MGRPSKGERTAITAKPDLVLGEVIRRNAIQLDMSFGDYLVALAAHALGMPEHAPLPGRTTDVLEELAPAAGEGPVLPASVTPIAETQTIEELRTRRAS